MNELLACARSGRSLYAVLLDSTGKAWNGQGWETIAGANWESYAVLFAEVAAGIYFADTPPSVAQCQYCVYRQAGPAPQVTDAMMAVASFGPDPLAGSAVGEIAARVRAELATELGRIDRASSLGASQTSVDEIAERCVPRSSPGEAEDPSVYPCGQRISVRHRE